MTIIPPDQLQPETLRGLVEEFVTRDGAVHGHVDMLIEAQVGIVLRQLSTGEAVIVFDESDESCTVVSREQLAGINMDAPRIVEE